MVCPSCGTISSEGLQRCPRCRSSLARPRSQPDFPIPVVRAPTHRGLAAQRAAGITTQVLAKPTPARDASGPTLETAPSPPGSGRPTRDNPLATPGLAGGTTNGGPPHGLPLPPRPPSDRTSAPPPPAGPSPAAGEVASGWPPPPGWVPPPGRGSPAERSGPPHSSPVGRWAPPDPEQVRPGPPPAGYRRSVPRDGSSGQVRSTLLSRLWSRRSASARGVGGARLSDTTSNRGPQAFPAGPAPAGPIPPSAPPAPYASGLVIRPAGATGEPPVTQPPVAQPPVAQSPVPQPPVAQDRTVQGRVVQAAGEPAVFAVQPPPPPVESFSSGEGHQGDDTLVVDSTAQLPLAPGPHGTPGVGPRRAGRSDETVVDGSAAALAPGPAARPEHPAPWPPPPGPWSGQRAGGS